MSIKKLFSNQENSQIQKAETIETASLLVESAEYIEAKRKQHEQFVPPLDFTSASAFAKFGSAELYYEYGFKRIYQYYPYDGTLAEKIEFENSSSYIDKHIFDNLYPRTNGYIYLNGTNYIKVLGGPHTASAGMKGKTLHSTFDDSMLYNEYDGRSSAFEINMLSGSTVEFWLKRSASVSSVDTIFDLWNGETEASVKYGRMKIFASGSNNSLRLTMMSGSDGFSDLELLQDAFTDNTWHHFALTVVTASSNLDIKLYKDNTKVYDASIGSGISHIRPSAYGIDATLGADISTAGNNKLTAYMDEFRFWKKARTHEAIANTWFIPVGGGTNKYDSNIDLGVYFKFNEGITEKTATDSIVLDYSGRINNGHWVGYTAGQRNTGSAIVESGVADREFQDPIIYSTHPLVSASLNKYKTSGSVADYENSSTIFNYFPAWMQESDVDGGNNLKYLSQIIGSYFDNLYHQINYVDKIHDEQYVSGSNKPLPFAKKLLYSKGFVIPDLFVDATVAEKLLNKDTNEVYEKQINEVRNTIYHNLYNNILGIYKSKGTEKSFRNFFRSLGIGSELVKLKLYADDSTFVLRDNYEYKSYPRKFLNFNYEDHFGATIFHNSSSTYGNTRSHIPAGQPFDSMTLETEIVLPRKQKLNESGYISYPYVTSSIMGFHSASTTSAYQWASSDCDLNIYVIKEKIENAYGPDSAQRIRFAVSSNSGSGVDLRSPWYDYQYENNKWNLAVKLKSSYYPHVNVSGATTYADSYVMEFYGVESEANIKRNSFVVSASVGRHFVESHKRIYGGAERTNYTGSVVKYTDLKLGYIRYWHSYMANEAVDQHAYDSETYGINEPFEVDIILTGSTRELPREKTLALHWGFNKLTSADASGNMVVLDLSSGSSATSYGPHYSPIVERYNSARVYGFPSNSTNALDKNYLYTARKRQPDDLLSSDLTTIKTDETEQFFVDDDVSDNFYSFEKSMYGVISDEMLNMFSTAVDFNNLIGQPNQKYHNEYKLLSFLKNKFFEDVENEPDIEKFTSFYKWIDDSISTALRQLTPASARFSEKIGNVVESHVLERNKYTHKIPLLTRFKTTEGSISGIGELLYDWQFGHAPVETAREDQNCLWQKERKEKTGTRETIRAVKNNNSLQSAGLIRKSIDGSAYLGSTYRMRKLSRPYEFNVVSRKSIHGGVNFSTNKNIFLFQESIAPAGKELTVPQNIITVGVGKQAGIVQEKDCIDKVSPGKKKIFNYNAEIGNKTDHEYISKIKGTSVLPITMVSGTVHTGYNKIVKSHYKSNVVITNIHNDICTNYNDVPMQGPFTHAHVGGLQYRHVELNKYDVNKSMVVSRRTGGVRATGSIEFVLTSLSIGDSVQILDADRTNITASYSSYYDLLDSKWNQPDQLVSIINDKLDVVATLKNTSPVRIALTASLAGTDGNVSMVASVVNITASGFGGGSAPGSATTTVNLDSPASRPEGWALVFKEHPAISDTDGAFGFLGADYGSVYPNPLKLKATRFRDEHAKRPVNVKNIWYDENSSVVGNYRKGYEILALEKSDQKRWHREAYDEFKVLPTTIRTKFPITTNYMTLCSQAPYRWGNVFNSGKSNRHPDKTKIIEDSGSLGSQASGSIVFKGRSFATDNDRIHFPGLNKSIVIDTNSSTVGGVTNVATGASDHAFYDNLVTGFNTVGYTANTSSVTAKVNASAVLFPNHGIGNDAQWMTSSKGAYYRAETNQLTVAMWFLKTSASTTGGYLFSFATGSATYPTVYLNTEPGMVLSAKIHAGEIKWAAGGTYNSNPESWQMNQRTYEKSVVEGNQGQWQHYVFTFDGTTSAEGLNLYHNASLQTASATQTNLQTATSPVVGKIDGECVFFNARTGSMGGVQSNELERAAISNIVIWNRVLSSCEIDKLYNGGHIQDITASTMASASLAAWYRTGAEQGSIPNDAFSANGSDGMTQQLYLKDYSGRGRPLSGAKGYATQLVSFTSSSGLTTAQEITFHITSSASGSKYNGWELTSSNCGAQVFLTQSVLAGGVDFVPPKQLLANDIVIPIPRTDLTSSTYEINTRFSAPGGPEVQSIGYLDAQTSTYSVHNALPYRNLSILGSGSGEDKTIRVSDQLGHRRGLRSLRQLHQGKFGIDPQYGSVTATSYPTNGSFNKQHRNTRKKVTSLKFDRCISFPSASQSFYGLETNDGAYDASTFPVSGGFAISFWFNLDDVTTPGTRRTFIEGKTHTAGVQTFAVYFYESTGLPGRLYFTVRETGGTTRFWYITTSNNPVTKGQWDHIYITWDGNYANSPTFYLNGIAAGSVTNGGTPTSGTSSRATTGVLHLGGEKLQTRQLEGKMQQLIIYSTHDASRASDLYSQVTPAAGIVDTWQLGNESSNDAVPSGEPSTVLVPHPLGHGAVLNPVAGAQPVIARGLNYSETELITVNRYDNGFVNTPIPRSDLQYSWIKAATSGSNVSSQRIVGYAPKDGYISSSADGYQPALVFPTISTINGS